jgi:hypothetical protein
MFPPGGKKLRVTGLSVPLAGFRIIPERATPYNLSMSAFENYRDELEKFEFMMGPARGRLAVSMDIVTDAMALVGQHGVYCQSQRYPGKPVLDIQLVMKSLTEAKELISSAMEELKRQREQAESK